MPFLKEKLSFNQSHTSMIKLHKVCHSDGTETKPKKCIIDVMSKSLFH